MMRRIKALLLVVLTLSLTPLQIAAADTYWTGNGEYHGDMEGTAWGVTSDQITKVRTPGEVYSIEDIDKYSAYITDAPKHIGKNIKNSFYWYNRSRLAYVKLFRVDGGQDISFVFSEQFYVYCAQFNSSYTLLDDGIWCTTGDVCTMHDDAYWMMVVFRKIDESSTAEGGIDTTIAVRDVKNATQNYVVFSPFTYTFELNGGTYNGKTTSFTKERLGVKKMTLPEPTKKGYTFAGWKLADGTVYTGTLKAKYSSKLFKNVTFTAVWDPITIESLSLNKSYYIFEQNKNESLKLKASITPADTLNQDIEWKSYNEAVATVDQNGLVKAGRTGHTIITATCGGKIAKCTIYVMGFTITVPTACKPNQVYEIKIDVKNNGEEGLSGRKRVLLDADSNVAIYRTGDTSTSYNLVAERSNVQTGSFTRLKSDAYLADTMESTTVYYKLVPEKNITKLGDYEGNVNFSVTVS